MNKLLNILAPYGDGYIPYLRQVKIDLRRAYLRGAILGLCVGCMIGLAAGLYWADMQERNNDIVYKEMSNRVRSYISSKTAYRDAIGQLESEKAILMNKVKKAGGK